MNLINLSISELAPLIRNKVVSAREVVQAYLKRIEEVNPKLNAIVVLRAEQALNQADELDALLLRGQLKGPLHGIPFTLKDVFNSQGDLVTAGTLGLKNNVAQTDATLLKRLYQAGGILLGKTNTPEFENGCDTENEVYGRTANPYNLNYSPGGSSGGSAAAVAAMCSVFDVGNDMGTSLRAPASNCGIATLRPTMGRIPNTGVVYGHRTGLSGLIATEGPLARKVVDAELIFKLISGPDGIDPKTIPMIFTPLHLRDISGFKIAYFFETALTSTATSIQQAVRSAVEAAKYLGAHVTEINPTFPATGFELFFNVVGANCNTAFNQALSALNVTQVSPLLQKLLERTKDKASDLASFMNYWDAWDKYRSDMLQLMKDIDVMICPVTACEPLLYPQTMWDAENIVNVCYCWSISMANLPVVVIRTGTSSTGIPIGVQIIAKPWREDIALAVAKQIEHAVGGWRAPEYRTP